MLASSYWSGYLAVQLATSTPVRKRGKRRLHGPSEERIKEQNPKRQKFSTAVPGESRLKGFNPGTNHSPLKLYSRTTLNSLNPKP